MKVFLSVGATYLPAQERFVAAFETFLSQHGCERLTVGRGNYGSRQPILQARDLMEQADAVVVLAFTRTLVAKALEKPGSREEKEFTDVRYPTIWNQLEASMAFGLKRPLMVILEEGLHQEAMLKDRHEFRAWVTGLDPSFLRSEEFRGAFADFKRIATERATESGATRNQRVVSMTVGELLHALLPHQLWQVGGALAAVLAAVAVGAYWVGAHFGGPSTP